jgi:hypothetical protein
MASRRTWFCLAVVGLLVVQASQIIFVIRGESLTYDEGDHMYAGYRMWTTGDYGLNPEHPPLVKLLATLPVLGQKLWAPPLKGIYFRWEAYLGGKAWLEHNGGQTHRLVFRMRLAAAVLAIALSCTIFFCALDWFGSTAALFALVFATFDPNLLAHSGLVTTDIGASLFFLAVIYSFYRYVKRPTWLRLLIAGVATGLLLATKYSGILAGPMLLLLSTWEIAFAPRGTRFCLAKRLAGALALISIVAIFILWSTYGFRYAARPAGLQLNPLLGNYIEKLTPLQKGTIWWTGHLHLLPESYLMGMTDLLHVSKGRPSILLGKFYPHSVWWHLPAVLAIKTTLGLMVATILAGFAFSIRRLGARRQTEPALRDRQDREPSGVLGYLLVPGAVYMAAVMHNSLNIEVRYLLPLYALAVIFAGAGLAMLRSRSRRWMWVCVALAAAHVASALSVLPSPLAYSNEAWGGARNTHLTLSESNVDWGQQLIHVKEWEDRHRGEECWLSYFVNEFISPETYGVKCHTLPNTTLTTGLAAPELVPPVIHGSVLLSAVEVSSLAWPSPEINPYRAFQTIKPAEEIDYGVLVFRGDVHMEEIAAVSRVFIAQTKLDEHKPQEAFELATEAVKLTPGHPWAQWELGDAAAALGKKDEARAAYQAAIIAAKRTQTGRSAEDVKELEETLKKL